MDMEKDTVQNAETPEAPLPVLEVAAETLPEVLKNEGEPQAETKKESKWEGFVSPILKMVVICAVTSLLLALTNDLTAGRIEENLAAEANTAMQQLLPEADTFETVPVTVEAPNVTAMYRAANGAGYVITAFGQGYGGRVPAMVAFGPDGNIVGVKFLANSETPGVGDRVSSDADFATQFAGLPPSQLAISDIDAFTGATISSKAALTAVNAANALYEEQVQGMPADAAATEGGD